MLDFENGKKIVLIVAIVVIVTAAGGWYFLSSKKVEVKENKLPVPKIDTNVDTENIRIGVGGTTVMFDARQSFDPDGKIQNILWWFSDDNSTKTENITYHHYTEGGKHRVVLKVTDDAGATNSTTLVVTVKDLFIVKLSLSEEYAGGGGVPLVNITLQLRNNGSKLKSERTVLINITSYDKNWNKVAYNATYFQHYPDPIGPNGQTTADYVVRGIGVPLVNFRPGTIKVSISWAEIVMDEKLIKVA